MDGDRAPALTPALEQETTVEKRVGPWKGLLRNRMFVLPQSSMSVLICQCA
jgi:hypothetical protein